MRAVNFQGVSALAAVAAAVIACILSRRIEVTWIAALVGAVLPYAYASVRRNKRLVRL